MGVYFASFAEKLLSDVVVPESEQIDDTFQKVKVWLNLFKPIDQLLVFFGSPVAYKEPEGT